jgi:hypothetical protein
LGQFQAACAEFVDLARADAATAHRLLHFLTLTWQCRSLAEFETERQLLIDLGVPEALLPDAGSGGSTCWREGERSARRCLGPGQGAVESGPARRRPDPNPQVDHSFNAYFAPGRSYRSSRPQWVQLHQRYGNWRGVCNRLRMWAVDGTWERCSPR